MRLSFFIRLLAIVISLFCFFNYTHSVYAQIDLPDQSIYEETVGSAESESLETFSTRNFLYYFHNMNLGILGSSSQSSSGTPIPHRPGAVFFATNSISQIIAQPPTSSVDYLAYVYSKIGPEPAYAQGGTGYQGLTGILPVWNAFKNIAYAFYILFFIVAGFMIMFRAKLNPQTVISLQQALPKLIITLILITFSYAIAGFVIDLLYFLIYLIVAAFDTFGVAPKYDVNAFSNQNIILFIHESFQPKAIAQEFSEAFTDVIFKGILGTGQGLDWLENIAAGIFSLVIGGAILFSVFKLLFQLILAYINIIIQVIFAPLILLVNAFPSANTLSSWLKNLIANAAAFPVTAALILIGQALVGNISGSANISTDSDFFVPPFLNFMSGPSQTTTGNGVAITSIIGLGIILLLPQAVKIVQEALKVKGAPVGPAIAQGIGAAAAIPASAIRSRQEAVRARKQADAQAKKIGQEVRGPT